MVFYREGQPIAVAAVLVSQQPFVVTTTDPSVKDVDEGKRALLILQGSGQFSKAEAQVMSVTRVGDNWNVEVGKFGWEEVDRRRYPRYPVTVSATVKAVLERDGSAQLKYVRATTVDLSLGGSWLRPEDPLKPGSLVEFQAELLPGETVRALAIVAWESEREDGVGLEFVDFLGGSRYYLHGFLTKAA